MKTLIALAVLIVLALAGSRRRLATGRLAIGGQMLFTGSEFIVIGLLLGSGFLNLIDDNALESLQPFVCVTLGWIGFLFGLQLERRTLRRLPRGILGISAFQAVVTMVVVFPIVWYLLADRGDVSGGMLVLATVTLAASAACTGQTALALVASRRRGSRSRYVMTLLRYISSLDPAVGVITFGVALSLFASHPWGAARFPLTLQWLVISLCLACLTAWIFVSLTLTRTSQSELGLYLLGTIALASGIAIYLQLSALFVNFVCGVVVANLAHIGSIRGRLMESLVRGERFLYILLLVLVGALWQLPTRWALIVTAAYIAVHFVGKVVGAYLATRQLARQHPVPCSVGLGLVSQAGMALAIIVELQLVVGGITTELVVSVAVSAIILNELMAPWLAMWVVGRPVGRTA